MEREFDSGYRIVYRRLVLRHPDETAYPPDWFGVEWGRPFAAAGWMAPHVSSRSGRTRLHTKRSRDGLTIIKDDLGAIPDVDLPLGLPPWMGALDAFVAGPHPLDRGLVNARRLHSSNS